MIKKIFILLTLIISLCACSSTQNTVDPSLESPNIPPVQTENFSTSDKEVSDVTTTPSSNTDKTVEKTQTSEKFVISDDLKIIASYVYSTDTYFIVENTGYKPILEYKIAYINFDSNGFVTTTDSKGYEIALDTTANLMPKSKSQTYSFGATGDYSVATVTYIKYSDGSEWNANNIDSWVKEQTKNFSVTDYKNSITALSDDAKLAEKNEYVSITDYSLVHDNSFSSDYDLHFSLNNTSSQGIIGIQVFVLEFDKNSFPVSVSPYDTYCKNGHICSGTINLAAGENGSYSDPLFINGSTTQIKIIPAEIKFQDETTWQNPYLYEWVLVNHNTISK